MPDLTPEQEQERLRLLQEQNNAANELFSTYEKLSSSVEQLKAGENELVSLSKQLVQSSTLIEESLQKRSEKLLSIVNLSKSLNGLTSAYNKSLIESTKIQEKTIAKPAVTPAVKAPTLPETITQVVKPEISVETPELVVTPKLKLGDISELTVTPNLVLGATPQLLVTPNFALAPSPVQTVTPNLVLGEIPQLTITPNLVAEANPILVTPNFVVANIPQQTVVPNLVLADPLAPLTVTPNLQLAPQNEPLFVTPRLLQKPVLDPLFVTPNFKLVPPTEPIEVTPNLQLAALSPLTVTPEIQVQTPVLTVTPEVNVVNPTVSATTPTAGTTTSSFPFNEKQLTDVVKGGIEQAFKKYERSPSLGVTLDKDKSGLFDKLISITTDIFSEIKKQLGLSTPVPVPAPAAASTVTTPSVLPIVPPPPPPPPPTGGGTTGAAAGGGTPPSTVTITPFAPSSTSIAKDLVITSEQLLDSSNKIIDSTRERSKLLKGTTAEEQLYLAAIKQQQKLSQNISANAENYLNFQIKSKELDKQIFTAKDNASKADQAFGKIETKLINDRSQALSNALNLFKLEKQLRQELQSLEESTLLLSIRRQNAIREGNTSLERSLSAEIKANQFNASQKEKAIKATESQLQREKDIAKSASEILKQGRESKKIQGEEIALLQQNLDIRKRIEKSTGLLGGMSKALTKLPGIGQYLNADEAINEMEKLAAEIEKSGGKATDFGNRLKIAVKGASTLAKGLIENLKSPEAIFTFFINAGLKADEQVTQLGKSLGVSKNVAGGMRDNMASFARQTGDSFINTDRLLKAQSELSEQLGIAVQFSNEELATFAKLTELTGLTAQEAGKLALNATAAGMSTEAYTKGIREGAFNAMLATKTHFSMKEVMQDISKLSAGTLIKFQGNPKALAQAVVEAKKLGSSLEQVDKIGDSLLNWESSINNELEAELMTGKQLNMERARAAALSGDQLALTREISSQVGTLADYQKMNVLAQGSLAKAFGLSRDEMAEMLMKQEAVAKYGDKAAQLNKEQLEDMKRQGLSADEYLKKQEQQRTAQAKFQDAITKLQTIFANLVDGPIGKLLDFLADAVGFVVSLTKHWFVFYPLVALVALNYLPKMLGGFSGITSSLGNIFSGAKAGFQGLMGGLSGLKDGIKKAFSSDGISGFFKSIKEGFTGTKSQFAGGSFSKGKELLAKRQAAGNVKEVVEGADKTKELAEKASTSAEKTSTVASKAESGGDAQGFKKKMQNIAAGIKAFADVKVLLGALNLIPSAIGLIAFIPGALGAKVVEIVNGEKFKVSMKGIAAGIKSFADTKVLLGSLNMILASAGLIAMVPGALAAAVIGTVGPLAKAGMSALASGIKKFGDASVMKGALGIALLGAALIPFTYAVGLLKDIDPATVMIGVGALAVLAGVAYLVGKAASDMIIGSVAIAILGAALIPFTFALSLLKGIGLDVILGAAGALAIFAVEAGVMGIFAPFIIAGSLAIAVLGAALIPFTYALSQLKGIGLDVILGTAGALAIFATEAAVMGIFSPLIIAGSLAIAILGAALIPFTLALSQLQGVGVDTVTQTARALAIFATEAGIMGLFAPFIIAGSGAIAILGLALMPFTSALKQIQGVGADAITQTAGALAIFAEKAAVMGIFSPAIIMGSIAMIILGNSLSHFTSALSSLQGIDPDVISNLSTSISSLSRITSQMGENVGSIMLGAISMFFLGSSLRKLGEDLEPLASNGEKAFEIIAKLQTIDASKLYTIGPALLSVKEGLNALNSGGGFLDLFKSDPVEQIERLASTSSGLQVVGSALQNVASAIVNLNTSLSGLDMAKLEKLAEMSNGGGISGFISGLFNTITNSGLIGETATTPPVTTSVGAPTTGITEKSKTPVSAETTSSMIAAINEVRDSVNKLLSKDTNVYLDGDKISKSVGQNKNTITNMNISNGYKGV